ncbi:tetratricopeptide repeat protein [bacterium]|nr:tetratricopeptide repeat protein [bacterium]
MAEKKNSPASGRDSEARVSARLKREVLKLSLRLTPALVFSLALTVGLTGNLCLAAQAQSADTASLRKISVDPSRLIVFEYASGGVKAPPQLFEMPSPDHRLIIDLPSTVIDTATMPSADDLSAEVNRVFPGIKRVRFLTPIKDTPTVRVAFDLAIPAKIKAALRILDGAVSLGLNEEYTQPVTAAAVESQPAAAPAADVYSQYAKALESQKPEQPDDKGEWGPRKGSADELKGVVKGFKPLVSSAALQTPLIQADLNATLPVEKKPVVVAGADTAASGWESAAGNGLSKTEATAPLRDTTPDVQITASSSSPAPTSIAEAAEAIEKETAAAPLTRAVAAAPVQRVAPIQRTAPVARATASDVEQPQQSEVAMAQSQAESQAAPANEETDKPSEAAAAPETATPAEQSASVDTNEGANNPKIQARRFFNKAVKEHLSGQLAQAIADYKAALAIDPELGDAHSNLGLAYNQQHNYANALAEFRKALAVNPSDAITYNGVGAALRAQKDVPGAIKNWETSVKLNPKLAVAHYNLGTAYESQGDLDRAMVSYESATRNDQRLGEAFYRMGLIMMKKHKSEEAKEQFKRALKISENSDYSEDARLKLAVISKAK